MNSLPNELLFSICSYLKTTEDLKSFRLLGRNCAAVGLHSLIPFVSIVVRNSSLNRLDKISSHPVLKKHVQNLKLYVDVVPSFSSSKQWRQQARLVDEASTTTVSPGNATNDTKTKSQKKDKGKDNQDKELARRSAEYYSLGWKHHQKLRKEQQGILESNALLYCIRASMPALRSPESVEMARAYQSDKKAMPMLYRPNPTDKWYVTNRKCDRQSFTRVNVDMFAAVTRSLRAGFVELNELNVQCFSWRMFAPSSLGYAEAEPLDTFVGALTLEHAMLDEDQDDIYDHHLGSSVIEASANKLHEFLTYDDSINCLTLKLDQSFESHIVDTKTLLGDATCSYLHMLDLQWVRVSGSHFIEFLKQHKGTLDRLTFLFLWLDYDQIDHDWIKFFEMIRDNPDIKLGSFAIEGMLFSDDWPAFDPEKPLLDCPQIDLGRAVRYLVCGEKTDSWDFNDDVAKIDFDWDSISWEDVTTGWFDSDEEW
ncbi:hypothetical protein MMC10_008846 [Thelotrema lepadinum]|nr:hypothetical protein [Thelotrema lepadinum]